MHRTDIKVCTIGASQVGKTSLIRGLAGYSFDPAEAPTIAIDLFLLPRKKSMRLSLWDTAGQERFQTIVRNYYRDASILVHVFSWDLEQSLDHLRDGPLEATRRHVLVGNKLDIMGDARQMARRAKRFAQRHKMRLLLVSAKTGEGLTELRDHLDDLALEIAEETAGDDHFQLTANPLYKADWRRCCFS